ncbi:MAG: carbamate kinase [Methanoregulaceae archaeon]|nr:carbamate kinase [Methanoregulaceae archaeon]
MEKRIVVALGGNAILRHREIGTAEEQFSHVMETCGHLLLLVRKGYQIIITHGNGPQVGDILLKNECARGTLPQMPLDICDAESQGMIGYMFQQSMDAVMKQSGIDIPVVTLVTQVIVDASDPAFSNPEKPVGPYYTAMEAAQLKASKGWQIVPESGRGYRRVVPSPEPIRIVEEDAIASLHESGAIVIACGGGGIPVILGENSTMQGVEAVIDKDHTSALLATAVRADLLLILTDVEHVYLNYRMPGQVPLTLITAGEAQKHLEEGHFAPGSMRPKIESAVRFLHAGGKRVMIASPAQLIAALEGNAGTTIVP